MYAIIECGGRQVRVDAGAEVTVDRIDRAAGEEITFDRVLLVGKDGGEVLTGAPYIDSARVVGVIAGEARGPKVRVFKKKRRKGMRRTRGHRSTYTRVQVKDIVA